MTGLRRNPNRISGDIIAHGADLNRPESLAGLERDWDAVVYTATPSQRNEAGYRAAYLEGLDNLLDRVAFQRLIFVSSTAVYGQDHGQWVDEDSPAEPQAFNGQVLLEAELRARRAGGIVLRFSGIYGPGRDWLLRRLRAGGVTCRREPPVWTNRIHSEDCAAALAHLLRLDGPESLYVASDCEPATRWEVLCWLAGRLGVAPPEEVDDQNGQGKRVSAQRLCDTGFTLEYPDYRAGYGEMLE